MNSSGVLAFYLSENEDPDLWRAMARLTQDDRTEVFRNALRYFVTSYDGPIFAGDSEEEERDNDSLAPSLFSSSQTSYGSHDAYESYESDEPYPFAEAHTVSRDMYAGPEEDTEWFEDEYTPEQDSQEKRHTLSPAISRSQTPPTAERLQKLFSEPEEPSPKDGWGDDYGSRNRRGDKSFTVRQSRQAAARAAVGGRMGQTVVQPEIQEVSLDDVFSDAPTSNTRSLRGLDFLLKNVIGEETDEAVLEAIRRKKAAASQ